MGTYFLLLKVTQAQEVAIKNVFLQNNWEYSKQEICVDEDSCLDEPPAAAAEHGYAYGDSKNVDIKEDVQPGATTEPGSSTLPISLPEGDKMLNLEVKTLPSGEIVLEKADYDHHDDTIGKEMKVDIEGHESQIGQISVIDEEEVVDALVEMTQGQGAYKKGDNQSDHGDEDVVMTDHGYGEAPDEDEDEEEIDDEDVGGDEVVKIKKEVTEGGEDENNRLEMDTEDIETRKKPRKRCPDCNRLVFNVKAHKKQGKCQFDCVFCGEKFSCLNVAKYLQHLRIHKAASDPSNFAGVKRAYKDGRKCALCNNLFKDRSAFFQHLKEHNEERPYACELCPARFYQMRILQRHILNVHTTRPKDYKCPVCNTAFVSQSYLNYHIRSVHTEKKYECDLCGSRFKTKSNLNVHKKYSNKGKGCQGDLVETNTSNLEFSIVVQDENGEYRMTEQKIRLEAPVTEKKDVSAVKPYKCDVCEGRFRTQIILKRHYVNVHTMRPKNHQCDECESCFATQSYLNEHKRTVHAPYELQCEICGKKFKKRSNVTRHMYLHETNGPVLHPHLSQTGFEIKEDDIINE